MKCEIMAIFIGAAICFSGSVLVYLGIDFPGYTAMAIGALSMLLGPLTCTFLDP